MRKKPSITADNILSLAREKKIEGKILRAKVVKNRLYYRIRVPYEKNWDIRYKYLKMAYATKREADAAQYLFPFAKERIGKHSCVLESCICLDDIAFKPLNWNFSAVIGQGEEEAELLLANRSYLNYAKYCSLFFSNEYRFPDGTFVYPYVDWNRNIALQYRKRGEYDDYRFQLKERMAALRLAVTYPFLKRKRICLVFEKYSQMAQDNAYYFFKYCMEHHEEQRMKCKIYYVITKDSPDREKLEPYKNNVIDFMSIRHITYALAAKLLISTDAKAHIYPVRRKGGVLHVFIRRRKLVFLQHGVTAMKKVDFFYGKGRSGECDMFCVTSDFEQKVVTDYFGYRKEQVPITGFARWDVLEDKSEGNREILIMPTWRNWLENLAPETFRESSYYKAYQQLLQNHAFYEMLETYDLKSVFYLHPKFKDYVREFAVDSPRIRLIAFGEEPLNEIMMRCRMLVTDYSSVAWDMFYQRKPVVFYQFDLDDYLEAHGSYLDLKKDLFGPTAETAEQLLERLKNCANGEFAQTEAEETLHQYYFKYADHENCRRICQAIEEKFLA